VLADFTEWLARYGETSWDHQSFFAGPVGRRAKSLYYWNHLLGTAAVAPIIFFEAFVPSSRKLFHHPIRFPIADAHYSMCFSFLCPRSSGSPRRVPANPLVHRPSRRGRYQGFQDLRNCQQLLLHTLR